MNKKLVVIIIAILVIASIVGIVSGVIPFHPTKATLISAGKVNLTYGGTEQGTYLVESQWALNYYVNGPQTAVLVLGGTCSGQTNCTSTQLSGTYNGQPVSATKQLYITMTAGQPEAWVDLSGQVESYAQAATGLECENPFGAYNNCQVNAEAPSPVTIYTSGSGASWSYDYPVTITVKDGNGNLIGSKTIDVFHQESVTIADPSNPDDNVTINHLGANIAGEGLPSANVMLIESASGQLLLFGGDAVQGVQQLYNNYWYGGNTQFSTPSPSPLAAYQQPGWKQAEVKSQISCAFGGCASTSTEYYYYPIEPQLSGSFVGKSNSSTYQSAGFIIGTNNYYTVTDTTYNGYGLTDYLQNRYQLFSYQGESLGNGMIINGTGGKTLQMVLPINVFTPEIQLLVSTGIVQTVISQVDNAQFQITHITPSSSSLQDSQSGAISVTVKDTSSYQGTATIQVGQSSQALNIQPLQKQITLQAGQTGTVTFNTKGTGVSSPTTDTITFMVINGQGTVTDTKTTSVTVSPLPTTTTFTSYSNSTTRQTTTSLSSSTSGGGIHIFWIEAVGVAFVVLGVSVLVVRKKI